MLGIKIVERKTDVVDTGPLAWPQRFALEEQDVDRTAQCPVGAPLDRLALHVCDVPLHSLFRIGRGQMHVMKVRIRDGGILKLTTILLPLSAWRHAHPGPAPGCCTTSDLKAPTSPDQCLHSIAARVRR